MFYVVADSTKRAIEKKVGHLRWRFPFQDREIIGGIGAKQALALSVSRETLLDLSRDVA